MNERAVLVTGGSRGIGAAIVRAFAANGDRVAIHYRDSGKLTSDLLAELPGNGHIAVQADLADPQAVRRMVDDAADRLGGLDVVVNNAGIYTEHPVTDVSYEEWQAAWQETLNVNLMGAANVTWCAVRHMIARGGGRIVNVSSRGAFRGEPRHPAYGASKAGLNALGQSLAVPLGKHGIAVATVAPGFVETDMALDRLNSPEGDSIRAQSPFNRVARPGEIAAAVLWLASPEAEWASGAILDLNGASYLRSLLRALDVTRSARFPRALPIPSRRQPHRARDSGQGVAAGTACCRARCCPPGMARPPAASRRARCAWHPRGRRCAAICTRPLPQAARRPHNSRHGYAAPSDAINTACGTPASPRAFISLQRAMSRSSSVVGTA